MLVAEDRDVVEPELVAEGLRGLVSARERTDQELLVVLKMLRVF